MQKCFLCHAACRDYTENFVREIVALRMENGYLQENICSSNVCRVILPIDKAIDYKIALNNSLEKICD